MDNTVQYFSQDGETKPIAEATVSLFDINYAYSYGVYETLKLRKGVIFFTADHCQRLMQSATILGIEHPYSQRSVAHWIKQLVAKNSVSNANIKVMLIGDSRGGERADTHLYILLLNPLFPPRKLYSAGAHTITVRGERHYPQAKSLDMLLSALSYKQAKDAHAYDALMINRHGCVTEGTRTNLFVTDGARIFTPPHTQTLFGVTKKSVIDTATKNKISIVERDLSFSEFDRWKGIFLTSTSSKIVPVTTVHAVAYEIPAIIKRLMRLYDQFLDGYLQQHE